MVGNLAYAYMEAGHLNRAILLYEQNLADRQRIMGRDHPGTLTARNNLARAYLEAARPHHAIYHFEQNLADSQRVLGPDHRITLAARNSLGNATRPLVGWTRPSLSSNRPRPASSGS